MLPITDYDFGYNEVQDRCICIYLVIIIILIKKIIEDNLIF